MVIVIDGYNVLKQLHDEIISAEERKRYINILEKYAKKKDHTIILVFDGGLSDWQSREKYGNVIVIYAGIRQTADDAIKRYLEDNKNKDLLLVTADRELVDYAISLKIVAIGPQVFEKYLKNASRGDFERNYEIAQRPAQKLHAEKNKELDRLMEEASLIIEHKPEEERKNVILQRRKDVIASKKERKIMNKLKKL